MTTTTTLTDFLLARVAEDEATARAASSEGGGRWWAVPSRRADEGDDDWFVKAEPPEEFGGGNPELSLMADYICSDSGWMDNNNADHGNLRHIARHDPARVLAECEAKRAIVDLHGGEHVCWQPDYPVDGDFAETNRRGDCATLRYVAAVYADHPDYRADWA